MIIAILIGAGAALACAAGLAIRNAILTKELGALRAQHELLNDCAESGRLTSELVEDLIEDNLLHEEAVERWRAHWDGRLGYLFDKHNIVLVDDAVVH